MSSPVKLVDRYRALSNSTAFLIAAVTSFGVATILGIFGGFGVSYLYDRGMGGGDDFAAFLGGLYAVGAFTFVILFTWIQKTHHPISSRISFYAFYVCLIMPIVSTLLFADEMDYFAIFFVGDWLAILILGLLSLLVCKRWWQREETGF